MRYFGLFFFLFLLSGCKKESNNPADPNQNTATGYIRAYVNGNNWQAEKIYASKSGTNINISALKDSSEIKIQIININQKGKFSIGEDEPGYIYFIKAKFLEKTDKRSC